MIERVRHQQRSVAIGNDTEWVTYTGFSCETVIT
jgi:hypothetical protein